MLHSAHDHSLSHSAMAVFNLKITPVQQVLGGINERVHRPTERDPSVANLPIHSVFTDRFDIPMDLLSSEVRECCNRHQRDTSRDRRDSELIVHYPPGAPLNVPEEGTTHHRKGVATTEHPLGKAVGVSVSRGDYPGRIARRSDDDRRFEHVGQSDGDKATADADSSDFNSAQLRA